MSESLEKENHCIGLKERIEFNQDFKLDWHDKDEIRDGYQLKWIGKDYARLQSGMMTETVIIPNNEHNNKEENKNSKNLFFTGDNLEVLRHLQNAYANTIDMIYIDPPYNTGSQDFAYNDNFEFSDEKLKEMLGFTDEEIKRLHTINGRSSHSAWLTFMYPRLKIAKKLLSNSGVIFISIDDNEQANLKLLCDEIFGEENFIDTLMVEMSNTGGMKVGAAKTGTITKNGEFVLLYACSEEYRKIERTPLYDFIPGYDTHFNLYLGKNKEIIDFCDVLKSNYVIVEEFKKFEIEKNNISVKKLSEFFDKSEILQNFVLEEINNIVRPRDEVPLIPSDIKLENGKWLEYHSEKRIEPYFLTINESGTIIQLVPMLYNYRKTDDFKPKYGRSVIRGDYWKNFWLDMGNISKEGDVEYKNGKKPVRLIKQLAKWAIRSNKRAFVLDFFAGSATTAHAVMQLNTEDNGFRQYIMVQIADKMKEGTVPKNATFSTIDELSRRRIELSANKIKQETNADIDYGYKHYYVKEVDVNTINKIEEFDPTFTKLIANNMVQEFDNEFSKGKDVIFTTWLVADGYKLDKEVEIIDFEGYKAHYIDNSLLYLIDTNWNCNQTKQLLNLIGERKLNINTIIVYGYSFTLESLKELEIAVKQNFDNRIQIEKRY